MIWLGLKYRGGCGQELEELETVQVKAEFPIFDLMSGASTSVSANNHSKF
jgi:hypothetical protein